MELQGLLGRMWEFPGGKQALVLEIEVGEPLVSIKHAFTHFRITLHAMHATHRAGEPQYLEVADHAWVTLADVDGYAFAVTDQKIIVALREQFSSPVTS